MAVSDKPWSSFTQADYTPEQWARACLIDTGEGDPESKDRYKLPVREPSGALNRNAVHAAVGGHGIGAVQGVSPEKKAAAARKLVSLYRNELDEDPPEGVLRMAGMADISNRSETEDSSSEFNRGPIEFRSASVDNINYANRLITIKAVPYESPGLVEYRGSYWHEIFDPHAFDGAEASPHRVRVNRNHDRAKTVGKVVSFQRGSVSRDGLITDVKIARTALGDETLALADEDCLSPSVGYSIVGNGERLEKRTMTRRINKAWLDHIAFVENPAFSGAEVLSVRETMVKEPLPPLDPTPNLDSIVEEMQDMLRWSAERWKRND